MKKLLHGLVIGIGFAAIAALVIFTCLLLTVSETWLFVAGMLAVLGLVLCAGEALNWLATPKEKDETSH